MKILFLQNSAFPMQGIMCLSAQLKKAGHDTSLFLTGEEKNNLQQQIIHLKPDIAAFSIITGHHHQYYRLAQICQSMGIRTLAGGPHPTFYPEDVARHPEIDYWISGEAEYAMVELITALSQNTPINNIANVSGRINGNYFSNPVRPYINNLDSLEFPDRDIYFTRYPFLAKASVKQFMSSRGCPYQCSFCANHLQHRLYRGKGPIVRRRSAISFISEIAAIRSTWGFRKITFSDDVFIMDRNWLEEFLPMFKREIGVPFMCNVRVNLVKNELIHYLKEHGCFGVSMGVESGNDFFRNTILKKNISRQQILKAGEIINNHKLGLKTYNMIGLPGETLETAMETVKLNALLKPGFSACSFLEPFPKYDVTRYCQKNGYLKKDFSLADITPSIYEESKIKYNDRKKISNLQTFFFLSVKFPFLIKLVETKLVNFSPNLFFRFIARVVYGISMSRVHRLGIMDIIRYALHIDPFQV
jgi:radical SAM superfamily enzyme YgiQ (UPF0313 family)